MGFESPKTNKMFLKVSGGVMHKKCKDANGDITPDSPNFERDCKGAILYKWENEDKKESGEYYRIEHGGFSGTITDIRHHIPEDKKYKTTLNVTISDGIDTITAQFSYESTAYGTIIKLLASMTAEQLARPLTLSVRKGKYGTDVFISQQDKNISWFWTKDSKEQLPQWKEVKKGGKTEWDKTDYYNHLYEWTENKIIPLVSGSTPAAPQELPQNPPSSEPVQAPVQEEEKPAPAPASDEDDSLPF